MWVKTSDSKEGRWIVLGGINTRLVGPARSKRSPTWRGILQYSVSIGTSNTSRLSSCCIMEGRRCLRKERTASPDEGDKAEQRVGAGLPSLTSNRATRSWSLRCKNKLILNKKTKQTALCLQFWNIMQIPPTCLHISKWHFLRKTPKRVKRWGKPLCLKHSYRYKSKISALLNFFQ